MGLERSKALAINIRDLTPAGRGKAVLAAMKQPGEAEVPETYRAHRITKDGQTVEVWRPATALVNETGQAYAIATTERRRHLGRVTEP